MTAERTCIGCGRKAPQEKLLRFAARDGVLVRADRASGRGAYTCRRLQCFERATSRHAFHRTLRTNVRIDPTRIPLYTEPSNG